MIRQIAVQDLRKGMYIVDTKKGLPMTPPHYTLEGYILSPAEVPTLLDKGFTEAQVDDERYTPYPEIYLKKDDLLPPEHVDFAEEQAVAKKLYSQSLEVAHILHEQIRTHKDVNITQYTSMFREMTDSLGRNQNTMFCAAKMFNKSEYTYTHSVNVSLYTAVLARTLGICESRLPLFAMAGFFHDFGKLFIPEEILDFPGKLSDADMDVMRGHPSMGRVFLGHYPNLPKEALDGALDHHERPDGSGYPMGKTVDKISLAGSIVAVADVYDALTSARPYKKPFSATEALCIMHKDRDTHYVPGFFEAFISAIGVYPPGCFVRLKNMYYGMILEKNIEDQQRPRMVLLVDPEGKPLSRPRFVDLSLHRHLHIEQAVSTLPCTVDIENLQFPQSRKKETSYGGVQWQDEK